MTPEELSGCPSGCVGEAVQYADVSLPLKLTPTADAGDAIVECCGDPKLSLIQCSCGGKSCELIITQTIRMRVPVTFDADVEPGDVSVACRRNPPCECCGTV